MTEKIPAAIELHCLGAFAVSHNAHPIAAFSTDKVRALLVYLALERGHPHRRETLAALLWPEMGQSAALNNLRLALHRLRDTLDKVQPGLSTRVIQSTRQTIQLDPTYVTYQPGPSACHCAQWTVAGHGGGR